ncbi:MAG TPA: hypothetical protein VFW77_01320 [Candidatus Saccharimonadales bacterium]|nr:hypothetical protein [Candidatus Saccharimonadales bacterium]
MEKMSQSRLASILTMVVGIWLLVSPAFMSVTGGALTNMMIIGAVFVVAGFIQLFWVNTLPSWINALVAIWLFISAFSYSVGNGIAWSETISAVVVFILATWDGVEISQVRQDRQHHAHT